MTDYRSTSQRPYQLPQPTLRVPLNKALEALQIALNNAPLPFMPSGEEELRRRIDSMWCNRSVVKELRQEFLPRSSVRMIGLRFHLETLNGYRVTNGSPHWRCLHPKRGTMIVLSSFTDAASPSNEGMQDATQAREAVVAAMAKAESWFDEIGEYLRNLGDNFQKFDFADPRPPTNVPHLGCLENPLMAFQLLFNEAPLAFLRNGPATLRKKIEARWNQKLPSKVLALLDSNEIRANGLLFEEQTRRSSPNLGLGRVWDREIPVHAFGRVEDSALLPNASDADTVEEAIENAMASAQLWFWRVGGVLHHFADQFSTFGSREDLLAIPEAV